MRENSKYFSFLSLCTPKAPVIVGDARLELAAQRPTPNAVMILDAYSADAVPTHLLTVEALDLYLRNLAQDGVLLFNISNQYFDLRPVLGNLAAARGLSAYYEDDASITESAALQTGVFGSRWVAMARKPSDLASIPNDPRWKQLGSYAERPALDRRLLQSHPRVVWSRALGRRQTLQIIVEWCRRSSWRKMACEAFTL